VIESRAQEARYLVIGGQRVRVVTNEDRGLPRKLDELLRQMSSFGFSFKADVQLAGTRAACDAAREHRFTRFREGRWWNPRPFVVRTEYEHGSRTVAPGLLQLALEMCRDCGAVSVRDVSLEAWAGGRPARLVNLQTGVERIAPALAQRNILLGWYSGMRRAGREYK